MSQVPAISPPTSRPKPDRPAVEFRILGPLVVLKGGRLLSLGGRKQRMVLALLILEANRVVSADRLIDQLWGDEPPEAARGTLQSYLSRLRKSLGPGKIEARAPGYVLHAAPDEVDAGRFERLVADAKSRLEGDPQTARSLLDLALELWRGPALDDLASEPAVRAHVSRLEELRLAAIGDRIEARMALGHHAELVPELERLVAEHSLREPFSAALVLALYRSERQAEALAAYERIRQLVSDELGVDPSPALRRLHERILRQDPELTPRGRRLRGYDLIERIGEGANGVVYRAIQRTIRRDVAVKVMHRGLANQPEFVRRFEQEAQLIARLEHAHIVPLYDYWREPDGAYLAMRHLRGGSLADRLEIKGPLTAAEASFLVEQVCSALAFAHRQGVVHGDVRPTNVLFDEEGNCYLSDFGIAIDLTVAGAVQRRYGKFAYYLAPEEIRSEPASAATDVYGLGLTLYEALTGRHAFADSPSSEMFDRQMNTPTPPIAAARPDLPLAVGAVISRATKKEPAARYADASSFAAGFREALAGASLEVAVAPVIDRNPYKGLRAFDEADAADFFGRDQLTTQMVGRLRETSRGHRLLAVVGPSGSGKSSAVRAGLLPAIRRGEVRGSQRWFVVEMHPGAQPFRELDSALLRVATQHPPQLGEELEKSDRGLVEAANQALPADGSELLLVVDQFEELFTLVSDEDRRNKFMEVLAEAACDPESRIRVVITLRADFYDRPLLHPRFGDLLASRTQAVTPMRSEDLERAIAGPAASTGATLEPGLIGAIVSDVANQPGSLPLLQYALTELFDQRTKSTLTLGVYRRMGGISGALSRTTEGLYRRLDETAKQAAHQVFLRLVNLGGEGSADSRRRVLRTELGALDAEHGAVERVVELFGAHRFLTFDRDPMTRTPTVEVAHEALLSSWRRLRGWIDSAREDLRAYRRFSAGAAEWDAAGRDPSFLLRGARLEQFEGWAKASHLAMSPLERQYLDASLRAREAEQAEQQARQRREALLNRRALNRLRAGLAVLVVGVLVAGSLALVAQERGTRAEREAQIAAAHELTTAAAANVDTDPELSLLLGLEAVRTTRAADGSVLPDTVELLHRALVASRVIRTFRATAIAWSPRGDLIASTSSDDRGKVQVAVGANGQPYRSWQAHDRSKIVDLAFSPDGKLLATSADESGQLVVKLWDSQGRLVHTLPGADHGLSFSQDGRFLSGLGCCSGASQAIVWEVASGREVADIDNRQTVGDMPADASALSPDGSRIAIAIPSRVSQRWRGVDVYDVKTGDWLRSFPGPNQIAVPPCGYPSCPDMAIAWSPNGTRLATAGEQQDSVIRIWEPGSGRLVEELPGHRGVVNAIAWSADGSRLASAGSDGTAKIWSIGEGAGRLPLVDLHSSSPLRRVAFSGDGSRILTTDANEIARISDLGPRSGGDREWTVVRRDGSSGEFSFSPDGQLLAGSMAGGKVGIWSVLSGEQKLSTSFPEFDVASLSPDGNLAAIAGKDGTVRISRVATGEVLETLEPTSLRLDGEVVGLRFSPDGQHLALVSSSSVSSSSTTNVIDVSSGQVLRHLGPYPGRVTATSIAFSQDSSLLAVGYAQHLKEGVETFGGSVEVARVSESTTVGTVPTSYGVLSVALDRSGHRLATASEDGVATVWDVATGKPLATTASYVSSVRRVALSPDGSRLATVSENGEVRLWDSVSGASLLELPRHAGAVVAVAFSPDGTQLASVGPNTIEMSLLNLDALIQLAEQKVSSRTLSVADCRRYLHVSNCARS